MKIDNCLLCGAHKDNMMGTKCKYSRHKFSVTDKLAEKYDRDILYIKNEHSGGRHIIASLGSAGYTFIDDIERLANYAYSQGDRKFYEDIIK